MRHYDELTSIGQIRRLRTLALSVLEDQYALVPLQLRLVAMHSFNTVFRVDTAVDRFALRIGAECRIHPHGVEDIEAAWLDALAEADHRVARIVPTATGRRWVFATTPGVPGNRVCTLFAWVRGRQLQHRLAYDRLEAAGRLLAALHSNARHSIEVAAPHVEARQAIYFGDADHVASFDSPHGTVFVEATERVQQLIDSLWAEAALPHHLLHGDFGPHNVLVSRDTLSPIDFQDLRFGPPQHDLGITIADLRRTDPRLVEPFTAGYEAVNGPIGLSPHELATLSAARDLNIMNLALLAPRAGIGQSLSPAADRVVEWMRRRN